MNKNAIILIADDDSDDCYLVKSAFEDCKIDNPLVFAHNGLEAFDYLKLPQTDEKRVGLIILDLNMPKMDGRETLKRLKSDPRWQRIPVIVMTTSKAPDDIYQCYELGANCYVTKPSSFDELADTIATMGKFWLRMALLPKG